MPRCAFLLSALLLLAAPVAAQAPADSAAAPRPASLTVRGVTWAPPEDVPEANAELRAMRDLGADAVRVVGLPPDGVLRAAVGYELDVFVDLPVENLPARRLLDSLAFAARELDSVMAAAQQFPAVQAVGLARASDTSAEAACAYFERLTERARAAGLRTYYVTAFIEDDQCAGTVDAVLLDARGRDPVPMVQRWRAAHEGVPVGVGAFGAAADDGVEGGHLTPRSPAAQARTLERGLRGLLSLDPAPAAVFVADWDGSPYGLRDAEGRERRALGVVRGFFTGRQTVFAVDAGPPPMARESLPGFVLAGWLIALLVAVLLTLAPHLRYLASRYFTRHGYYRESVQRSSGLETWAAVGMGAALALAAGVLAGVLLGTAAETDVLAVLTGGMSPDRQAMLLGFLGSPVGAVLTGALAYAVWLLLNMVWLFALTGKTHRIRPGQAFVLATFSRWPLFVLMVLALLAAQTEAPLRWASLLLGGWVAVEVIAGVRMLYDFGRVARVPMPRAAGLGFVVPAGVIALVVAAFAVFAGPELAFLWNLATKT